MLSQMAQAWRSWKNAKAVACLAVAALAVGIGSTTAIYTVVDAVLLKPFPFNHAERYVAIFSARKGEEGWSGTSWLNLLEYQRRTTSFDSFGIYQPREFTLTAPGLPRHITAVQVTPSFIRDLGIAPVRGRWFNEAQREQGNLKLAVISEGLWESLGSDSAIAGKTLTLDGSKYTVTGVAPAWFRFPVAGTFGEELRADVWVPLDAQGGDRDRTVFSFFCNARMKPGVTLAQADADVKRAAAQIGSEFVHDPGYTAFAGDLVELATKSIRPTLLLLLGSAGALLLITCANVAGLLLARSVARGRETAVRVALGATRGQLAAQFFAEGLFIALAGTGLGIGVSIALVRVVLSMAGNWIPRADSIRVSPEALLFACLSALACCLLFSLAPLWQAARTQRNETLSDGARTSAGARSRYLSRSLVIAEIALAFTLVSVGAVLLNGLSGLLNTSPGFNADHLLTFSVNENIDEYPKPPQRDAYQKRLTSAIASIPGVEGVAVVAHIPLNGCCYSTTLTPEGRAWNPVADKVAIMVTDGNYLKVMGIPVVNGRFVRDLDADEKVALGVAINARAAQKLWPNENPIGKRGRFSNTGSPAQVVGVVGNVKNNELGLPTEPEVYLIATAVPMNPVYFAVRSQADAAALVPQIRRAVLSVDRTQAMYDIRTMREIILDSVGSERLRSYLITFFALSALLMAALGVYGVVSYSVRNRTVEIGTRLAVGAQRTDVLRLIIGEGFRMAGWGVIAGGIFVAGAAWLLRSEVFGIEISDIRPFLYSTGVIAAIISLACVFPAWRAMLLSPMAAIRDNAGWVRNRAYAPRKRAAEVDIAEGVLLAEFVEASRTASTFRDALALALGKVREVMHATSAVVQERESIPAGGLLAGRLRNYPWPLPLSDADYDAWSRWAEAERRPGAAEIAALREGRVALAVPLLAKNEISGLLLLGPPVGRETYSETEKRVLRNCAGQFALMIENARLTERIVEQEKLRRDMQMAMDVQKRLFPERPPSTPGVSLAGRSIPARGVGGDYYDFLDLGGGRVGIALADVAGKGIAAALIMSVVQASLRIIAVEDISLAEVAARMNRYLHKSTKSNGYATFFYACVDEDRRRLRYVNAGHNPPYLLRRNASGAVEELPAGGTVIGLFPQMSYTEAAIDLAPGDVLMAFTDGVPEAQNPAEEEFGEDRVRELLTRHAEKDVEAIAAEVSAELKSWIAGADQYDDLTFILLKVEA
jgi:predicted permease